MTTSERSRSWVRYSSASGSSQTACAASAVQPPRKTESRRKKLLQAGAEQIIAPGQRGPQRPVPPALVPAPAGQQLEPLFEPLVHLRRRQRREPAPPPAPAPAECLPVSGRARRRRRHCCAVIWKSGRAACARSTNSWTLAASGDLVGRPVLVRQGQRRHREFALAGQRQPPPGSHQAGQRRHPRQQGKQQGRSALHQMLEIIQHQQGRRQRRQIAPQSGLKAAPLPCVAGTKTARWRRGWSEPRRDRPAAQSRTGRGKTPPRLPGGFQRQPGLAAPARPGQRTSQRVCGSASRRTISAVSASRPKNRVHCSGKPTQCQGNRAAAAQKAGWSRSRRLPAASSRCSQASSSRAFSRSRSSTIQSS